MAERQFLTGLGIIGVIVALAALAVMFGASPPFGLGLLILVLGIAIVALVLTRSRRL